MRLLSSIKTFFGLETVEEKALCEPPLIERTLQVKLEEEVGGFMHAGEWQPGRTIQAKYKVILYSFTYQQNRQTEEQEYKRRFTYGGPLYSMTLTGARVAIINRMIYGNSRMYYQIYKYNPRYAKTGRLFRWTLVEKGNVEDVVKWLFPDDDEFFFALRDRLNSIELKHKYQWPGYKFSEKELDNFIAEFYAGADNPAQCELCDRQMRDTHGENAWVAVAQELYKRGYTKF